MHETRVLDLFQLKRGIYVNGFGDVACFFDRGSLFSLYCGGNYHVYTVKCNYATKMAYMHENKRPLAIDTGVRNYCDGQGNKIELGKKGSSFTLIIKYEESDLAEIHKLNDLCTGDIVKSFFPREYVNIVNALAEKPIDIEIINAPSANTTVRLSLNICNHSLGSLNESTLINKLLTLRSVRFVYSTKDESIDTFLRHHSVPKELRFPTAGEK